MPDLGRGDIDAGERDEFWTSARKPSGGHWRRSAPADVFVGLFDATHMAIEYRYALRLKYLAERLS